MIFGVFVGAVQRKKNGNSKTKSVRATNPIIKLVSWPVGTCSSAKRTHVTWRLCQLFGMGIQNQSTCQTVWEMATEKCNTIFIRIIFALSPTPVDHTAEATATGEKRKSFAGQRRYLWLLSFRFV